MSALSVLNEMPCFRGVLERAMGIEPTSEAWEASSLTS
jgi:hypothetical protein